VQVLVGLMFGTLVLQAGLGAGAVLAPQSPFMLATHFGVSLICFAATFLSLMVVFERTGRAQPRRRAMPAALKRLVLFSNLYVLLVVYLGAYVRHADLSLACADWPLCNGQIVPALDGTTGFVFGHRLAALGAILLLGWLATRLPGLARVAFGLVVLQALSGALVVWTQLGLFSTLAHAAIMALLFAALAQLAFEAVRGAGRDARDDDDGVSGGHPGPHSRPDDTGAPDGQPGRAREAISPGRR
jgi:cytochrome c oxidase assembly protein subunit 15